MCDWQRFGEKTSVACRVTANSFSKIKDLVLSQRPDDTDSPYRLDDVAEVRMFGTIHEELGLEAERLKTETERTRTANRPVLRQWQICKVLEPPPTPKADQLPAVLKPEPGEFGGGAPGQADPSAIQQVENMAMHTLPQHLYDKARNVCNNAGLHKDLFIREHRVTRDEHVLCTRFRGLIEWAALRPHGHVEKMPCPTCENLLREYVTEIVQAKLDAVVKPQPAQPERKRGCRTPRGSCEGFQQSRCTFLGCDLSVCEFHTLSYNADKNTFDCRACKKANLDLGKGGADNGVRMRIHCKGSNHELACIGELQERLDKGWRPRPVCKAEPACEAEPAAAPAEPSVAAPAAAAPILQAPMLVEPSIPQASAPPEADDAPMPQAPSLPEPNDVPQAAAAADDVPTPHAPSLPEPSDAPQAQAPPAPLPPDKLRLGTRGRKRRKLGKLPDALNIAGLQRCSGYMTWLDPDHENGCAQYEYEIRQYIWLGGRYNRKSDEANCSAYMVYGPTVAPKKQKQGLSKRIKTIIFKKSEN